MSMFPRSLTGTLLVALILAGVIAAGCTSPGGTATPTPTVTARPTPAPPTPTPTLTLTPTPAIPQDIDFSLAYEKSADTLLAQMGRMNIDLAANGEVKVAPPDWKTLRDEGMLLEKTARQDYLAISQYTTFRDPALNDTRNRYIDYLTVLKFIGSELAQACNAGEKKEYDKALAHLGRMNTYLSDLTGTPDVDHTKVLQQMNLNLARFTDVVKLQKEMPKAATTTSS